MGELIQWPQQGNTVPTATLIVWTKPDSFVITREPSAFAIAEELPTIDELASALGRIIAQTLPLAKAIVVRWEEPGASPD